MSPRKRWDAVIIGSGAGGGALALELSRTGLEVLVLEKGRRHRREAYATDELTNSFRGFFLPPIQEDPHILVHESLAAPRPTHMGWTAVCLGGGTEHMGAHLSRFQPEDFRMVGRFGELENFADWPYSYDDLEPYYCKAEWEVGVAGQAGANPFEGGRSRPYPLPPLTSSPLAESLGAAARRLGLHPFPTPHGINSRAYQGRPACSYCRRCPGFGCPTGARGSSQEALLTRALETGRCEVRTRAMVYRITVDPTRGAATGCVYRDEEGTDHGVEARIVCVCCSAVESARLLLLSSSNRFPDGLANGFGQVGRHLQFHGTSTGTATFALDTDLPFDDPNPFLVTSLSDFYLLPDGVSEGLAKGGTLIFHRSAYQPISSAMATARTERPTLWGMDLKKRLKGSAERPPRTLAFEIHHDFVPTDGTFVELDPETRDRWGLPVARMHLEVSQHQREAGQWLVEKGLEVFGEMGANSVQPGLVGETAPYLVHGTCRAGRDPETSVLDPFCQAHEVPNLYVVDGSFMPTAGGAPPTLTILANAFRVAEHLVERGRRGDIG